MPSSLGLIISFNFDDQTSFPSTLDVNTKTNLNQHTLCLTMTTYRSLESLTGEVPTKNRRGTYKVITITKMLLTLQSPHHQGANH